MKYVQKLSPIAKMAIDGIKQNKLAEVLEEVGVLSNKEEQSVNDYMRMIALMAIVSYNTRLFVDKKIRANVNVIQHLKSVKTIKQVNEALEKADIDKVEKMTGKKLNDVVIECLEGGSNE